MRRRMRMLGWALIIACSTASAGSWAGYKGEAVRAEGLPSGRIAVVPQEGSPQAPSASFTAPNSTAQGGMVAGMPDEPVESAMLDKPAMAEGPIESAKLAMTDGPVQLAELDKLAADVQVAVASTELDKLAADVQVAVTSTESEKLATDIRVESAKLAKTGGPAQPAKPAKPAQPAKPTVYLTFDDGPSEHTLEVLDILSSYKVTATFFMLGEHVDERPDIVRRVVQEGHAIGNHTYDHEYKKLYGGFAEFARQLMKTDQTIYQAAGQHTRLVRAPGGSYGNFDKGYWEAMRKSGYLVHDWNVDSGDSRRLDVTADEIIQNIHSSKLAHELTVLLHDSHSHAETIKALPRIIDFYKGKGYTFAALNEQVKPVQFSQAAKLKWSRGEVELAAADELRKYVLRMTTPPPQPKPPLLVHLEDGDLKLAGSEYMLSKGVISVPLDKLVEALGGTYTEDRESGIAEAAVGDKRVFWVREEADLSKPHLVPIRAALSEFGIQITDYAFTAELKEIWT